MSLILRYILKITRYLGQCALLTTHYRMFWKC